MTSSPILHLTKLQQQQLLYSGKQIRKYNFDPPAISLRANLGGWILIC